MNTPLQPSSFINIVSYPVEFQQIICEKSQNFVGREFVFTAIAHFLHRYNRGYFTIVGAPGSGKSAILAKYVTVNLHVLYYNTQLEGKNHAEEFLRNICTQLVEFLQGFSRNSTQASLQLDRETSFHQKLPDNATKGSWFLSLLLQKISDYLEPEKRLIIAIDALDSVDLKSQSSNSNLFYLPRYLPDKVYFLLSRRPFLREKSGLLIETPSQILDLENYPKHNREDMQVYIQQNLKTWLTKDNINEQEFIARLTDISENNFMYLSQVLPVIAGNFGADETSQFVKMLHTVPLQSPNFITSFLSPELLTYYQSHWQKMRSQSLSDLEFGVLRVLTLLPILKQEGGMSVEDIAQTIDEDVFDVEEVLENWLEFLQQQVREGEVRYSFYHSSFCHWLSQQIK
jgi:AAA ATPase domain